MKELRGGTRVSRSRDRTTVQLVRKDAVWVRRWPQASCEGGGWSFLQNLLDI